MYNKNGELKNKISIDGIEYVLNPQKELEQQEKIFTEQREELNQRIKHLEQQLKQNKNENNELQMINSYQHYLLERLLHKKYEGRDIDSFTAKVHLKFIEEPRCFEEITKKFKNIKEALLFIKKQISKKIDDELEVNGLYCEVLIEMSYENEIEGKTVEVSIPELTTEFVLYNSKEMTTEKFLSVLKRYD